ncbi:hypothetical protein HMPREF9709_01674 [Helcococcus kunzii ATCC 51366]|uniref:DUF4177 domain-containing protein n=1 Tax=Helcococcus kunzii ATCC 51366 TaxID=883114 RepID=H3NQR3_9FIRM|nr:DUF4177 domain-containing protein [Helcococcus kunzii]EHR32060.1 hypothetical protein HMPREF9709_01674 [Helcococcus kunzii ATCC 51366]
MYKYKYVTLNKEYTMYSNIFEEYREIIDENAAEGYRYVGYMPVKINPNGKITILDLIFEYKEEK